MPLKIAIFWNLNRTKNEILKKPSNPASCRVPAFAFKGPKRSLLLSLHPRHPTGINRLRVRRGTSGKWPLQEDSRPTYLSSWDEFRSQAFSGWENGSAYAAKLWTVPPKSYVMPMAGGLPKPLWLMEPATVYPTDWKISDRNRLRHQSILRPLPQKLRP